MKYFIRVSFLLLIGFSSCSAPASKEEKEALIIHLDKVIQFEKDYINQLNGLETKKDFISVFKMARKDVAGLLTAKKVLEEKHPYFKKFKVRISRIPADFEDRYMEIIKNRLEISRMEYNLMIKYKTQDLDNAGVFILGSGIKNSVFINQ